ncbi:MAG TPA: transposase [Candidatus Micrarchaeia archaeon]|nr:transposase [Candidatus Micrarchaeia archaeon]
MEIAEASVARRVRKQGLSPRRPLYRADQHDPERVERWWTREYPRSRAEARRAGAPICFADESAVRSDHHAGTTWAAVGATPVVTATGARCGPHLISAVAPGGALRFRSLPDTLTAPQVIDVCRRIRTDAGRPVIRIVDGHAVHRCRAVACYVASAKGQRRLGLLPPYSPQLHPDE